MDTTYAHAQANLASLCDFATSTLEPVVIRRRGAEDVALIAASELRSLEQTLHELRSPRNAARLFAALARAVERETPSSVGRGPARGLAIQPSYASPMKTAISLPDSLFESAEAMAAEMGISRSQLYATAIREFVQAQKRNGITESLDRVYEKVDQTPDPFLEALHLATLTRDPW